LPNGLKRAGYFTCHGRQVAISASIWRNASTRGFHAAETRRPALLFADANATNCFLLDGKKLQSDDPQLPKNWYTTDLWPTTASSSFERSSRRQQPFFLSLAHTRRTFR